ncbi:hypothetical protein BRE01_49310 [Brevibacillus reuszeri]|uniref:Uncharacterized protein n=1 Tax=Brevibacillus reuszeri TaxID=54915 RepID=A0A0K9YLA7_9BACL|nr:hypothetical protein [Brevibacillus reuszeri]KNB69528.1 hypothetical protein ADS79_27065 [Brevibacillus reuszeri]MED1856106.1 hypothetical protein [Brevibacillus reuszeri]GED71229.1 hypothetical protein BRE01_49310 [Brevibacillus reuszeri]
MVKRDDLNLIEVIRDECEQLSIDPGGINHLSLWKNVILKYPLEVLIEIDRDMNNNFLRSDLPGLMHQVVKERIKSLATQNCHELTVSED